MQGPTPFSSQITGISFNLESSMSSDPPCTPGTLVWAKYGTKDPWWPAEVECVVSATKVRVFFFGEEPSNGDVSRQTGVRVLTAENFYSFASTSDLADFHYACAQAVRHPATPTLGTNERKRVPVARRDPGLTPPLTLSPGCSLQSIVCRERFPAGNPRLPEQAEEYAKGVKASGWRWDADQGEEVQLEKPAARQDKAGGGEAKRARRPPSDTEAVTLEEPTKAAAKAKPKAKSKAKPTKKKPPPVPKSTSATSAEVAVEMATDDCVIEIEGSDVEDGASEPRVARISLTAPQAAKAALAFAGAGKGSAQGLWEPCSDGPPDPLPRKLQVAHS